MTSNELWELLSYRLLLFWLPAARVRVPDGAPFSQLQQREKGQLLFVKSNNSDPIPWRTELAMAATSASSTLEFPGEHGMLTNMYAQVREDTATVHLWSERKQVDDGAAMM